MSLTKENDMEVLKALAIIQKQGFEVIDRVDNYEIRWEGEAGLAAVIDKRCRLVEYYVTGVYNSGCDYVEINIEVLEDLKTVVKSILGE
jgi:hypothetical protein